jgi:hypothetical protein
MTADQDWFRSRMALFQGGLLDPDAERRFRALLTEDAVCGEIYAAFGEGPAEEPDLGDHLPASLIARWPEVHGRLRGLERDLVTRHLERCPDCREALRLLGHAPSLEDVAPDEAVARRAERGVERRTAAPPSRASRPKRLARRSVQRWTAAAMLAAAVLSAVLVLPGADERFVRFTEEAADLPVLQLEGRVRGFAPRQEFVVDEGARRAVLDLSLLVFRPDRDPETIDLRIVMLDPEGRRHELPAVTEADLSDLRVVVGDDERTLPLGVYRLEIELPGTSEPRIESIEFEIVSGQL